MTINNTIPGGITDEPHGEPSNDVEIEPRDSDPEPSFDPDTQTLGTTSLGTDAGTSDEDDDDITVTEQESDPSTSSPAGGAGTEEAVERFAGLPNETLDDASREETLRVGNIASDAMQAVDRAEGMVETAASGSQMRGTVVAGALLLPLALAALLGGLSDG